MNYLNYKILTFITFVSYWDISQWNQDAPFPLLLPIFLPTKCFIVINPTIIPDFVSAWKRSDETDSARRHARQNKFISSARHVHQWNRGQIEVLWTGYRETRLCSKSVSIFRDNCTVIGLSLIVTAAKQRAGSLQFKLCLVLLNRLNNFIARTAEVRADF